MFEVKIMEELAIDFLIGLAFILVCVMVGGWIRLFNWEVKYNERRSEETSRRKTKKI